MDSEIPDLYRNLRIAFGIGHNFETIINGEWSVLSPSVTRLWYMTTLFRKHVSINSILFDNKHH